MICKFLLGFSTHIYIPVLGIKKASFTIHSNSCGRVLNLEKYGLMVFAQRNSIGPKEKCKVKIKVLVGGNFRLPKHTKLVSAVYGVFISKPLRQKLRLEVQHCVNLVQPSQTRHLKFAIAQVDAKKQLYKFSSVNEGTFPINSYYGSISRTKFCLVGVIAEEDGNTPSRPQPLEQNDDNDDNDDETSNDQNMEDINDFTNTPVAASIASNEIANASRRGQLSNYI